MIKRNTWILLGIFVIVLAFAIYYQNSPKKAVISATSTPGTIPLFNNVDEKKINTLRVEDTNGNVVVLGRDASGIWVVNEPKGGPTDVTQAETAVSQLLALQNMTALDPSSDLGIFGLAKPSYTVTISMNGGDKYVLLIGDVTPTQNGYYARLNQGAPNIVNKDSVDAMLGMLTKPPFLATPTTEPGGTSVSGSVTPASSTQTPELSSTPVPSATGIVTTSMPLSTQPAVGTATP